MEKRNESRRKTSMIGGETLSDGSVTLLPARHRGLSRFRAPQRPWHEQVREAGFWFCAVGALVLIALQAVLTFNPDRGLMDYGSSYASGRLANLHTNPYVDDPLVFHVIDPRYTAGGRLYGARVGSINMNPPVVLYLFRLLARLDPTTGFSAWRYMSLGLFAASLILVWRMYPDAGLRIRLLWVLALAGVWHTFMLGQIYMILLLTAALAWRCLRKEKWIGAALGIGLICAIKPNFLVWPVLLMLGRGKKTGLAAIATTAALSAIPLFVQGPLIYRQWMEVCGTSNGYESVGNSSLLGMFARAGFPRLGLGFTVAMLGAVAIWTFVKKPAALFASKIGILATLLAGPITWDGYTILLIPILYGESMDVLTEIACVLLCVPLWGWVTIAEISRVAYVLLEAPAFYGLVLIAFSAVRRGA
jgi:hypothetical protein